MAGKNVIRLEKHEDLESYVAQLDGREHAFFRHKTTEGIYIIDLRPYGMSKKAKRQKSYEEQIPLFEKPATNY